MKRSLRNFLPFSLTRMMKWLVSPRLTFFLLIISCSVVVSIGVWLAYPDRPFISSRKIPIHMLLLKSLSSVRISSAVFSELLQLSADEPRYLQDMTITEIERTLWETKVFSSLSVEKMGDSQGLSIIYAVHEPIGYVGNKTNSLLNAAGHLFPCYPYFPALELPEIFFSEKELQSSHISEKSMKIVNYLLQSFEGECLATIDMSHIHEFPQEILVTLKPNIVLRLHYETLDVGLKNFFLSKSKGIFPSSSYICDLRFSDYLLLADNS